MCEAVQTLDRNIVLLCTDTFWRSGVQFSVCKSNFRLLSPAAPVTNADKKSKDFFCVVNIGRWSIFYVKICLIFTWSSILSRPMSRSRSIIFTIKKDTNVTVYFLVLVIRR